MKFCKKVLSVLLSLALCGSMVAPAFAATFEDLQQAISNTATPDPGDSTSNGTEITIEHEDGTSSQGQGYAWNTEAENWGIKAWDEGDTRHVQLNENVKRPDPAPVESPPAITVSDKVVIDEGKNIIDGNGQAGIFDVCGSTASLTVKNGTIQGGKSQNNGGAINATNGATVDLENVTVTKNTADGNGGAIYAGDGATVNLTDTTVKENTAFNGNGIYVTNGAAVNLKGSTVVSGNGDEDVYLDADASSTPAPATLDGTGLTVADGTVWTETNDDGTTTTTQVTDKIESDNSKSPRSLTWTAPEPSEPANPGTGGNGNTGDTGTTPPVVEIEDPDTPMAEGPISCAEFIYKLWLLDGEPAPLDDRGLPATVSEDHEYAEAIAWAVSADVASIETFDPEELLTVDLARGFLTNFAAYADMVMPELTTLIGDDDDLVLNTDDVLAEFFGRELNA